MGGHKILASDETQEKKVQMVEGNGWLGARKLHPDLCSSLTQTSVDPRMLQGTEAFELSWPQNSLCLQQV